MRQLRLPKKTGPNLKQRTQRVVAGLLLATTPFLTGAASTNVYNFPSPANGTSSFGPGTSAVAVSNDASYGMISPTNITAFLDTSFSLMDVDPFSGTLIGHDINTTATDAYAMTYDMSEASFAAVDTAELARKAVAQAEAARKAEAAAGDTEPGEHGVGPDGCPTSSPGNTLREGAANIGIAKLCANSVAQAPHQYAAKAIKYQLQHLGQPYSQPRRMSKGHYDCSSLAMRSYDAAGAKILQGGWAPNTTAIRAASWSIRLPANKVKPGDLIFPFPGHVATQLSDGYMVHTNRTGDVSHVKKSYKKIYYAVRVNPQKV